MENYNKRFLSVYRVAMTLLVFLVVISSASIWVLEDVEMLNHRVIRYLIWLLAIVLIFYLRKIRINNNIILIFLCFIGYSILHVNYIIDAMFRVFIPVFLFYLLGVGKGKTSQNQQVFICKVFSDVMCCLALTSLFFFIFGSVLKIIKPSGYLSYSWSWIQNVPSFYNIYFEPISGNINQKYSIAKNCGIFPEAPMFCFPLCIALGIEKLLLKDNNKAKSVLLFITILSTASTSGLLYLLCLYGYQFVKKYGIKRKAIKLIIFLTTTVLGIILFNIIITNKAKTSSYRIRFDHMMACIRTIKATSFLGSGTGNESVLRAFVNYDQGMSVGLLYLFALGGIFCFLLFIIPIINSCIIAFKHNNNDIIVFNLLFLILVYLTQVVFRNNMWFIVGTLVMNTDKLVKYLDIQRIQYRNNCFI